MIEPFAHLLVATDFSEPATWAAEAAAGLARSFGADVTLMTVVQPLAIAEPSIDAPLIEERAIAGAKQALNELAAEKFEGVTTKIVVAVELSVAATIERYVDEQKVDLIVLGTRGRGGFARLLLGSVAEQVVRHAPCSVLTVGKEAFRGASLANGIVVASDLSDGNLPALMVAGILAKRFKTKLTALHVHDPEVPYPAPNGVREAFLNPEDVTEKLETDLEAHCAMHLAGVPAVRSEVLLDSDPAHALVEAAERLHPEVMVIATHGRTGAKRVLLGSVAERVVRRCGCPVLTVRRG